MPNPGEPIYLVRLEVENYQGLRLAEVTYLPKVGLVRVTGNNAAGKTSLLNALAGALGGATEVHPRVIHDESGDGTGRVEAELSNGWTVHRKHTESNPKGYLTISPAAGPDLKAPQSKLDDLVGPLSFDVQAFFSLKPERQREILLGLGGDPDLAAKLAEKRALWAAAREARTPLISEQNRVRSVTKPSGERPEPVDTSAEMIRLRELQGELRERADVDRGVVALKASAAAKGRRAQDIRSQLAALQEELATVEIQERALREDVARQEAVAAERMRPEATIQAEIEAVTDRISRAGAIDRSLDPWKQWDDAKARLSVANAQLAVLNARMDEAEAERLKLIEAAEIPVDGVSFEPDGTPLYRGRPFELASGGERIDLAVDVVTAACPPLRLCLIDEANDLDLDAIERLHIRAVERGFLVLACRIGLEGPGEIVVENGEARSAKVAAHV